jgi:hypothetical protein
MNASATNWAGALLKMPLYRKLGTVSRVSDLGIESVGRTRTSRAG